MNKLFTLTLLASALALNTTAHAGDSGFYLGASAGSVTSTVNKEVVNNQINSFDGKDAAYKIIAGLRPLDWLSAEVNYLDLGKPDSGAFNADSTALSGSGLLIASLGPVVEVFGKAGAVSWNSKITDGINTIKKNGTDPLYGGGLMVHLGSLSVRAEYEHFDMDVDSNLLSVGLTWTFL